MSETAPPVEASPRRWLGPLIVVVIVAALALAVAPIECLGPPLGLSSTARPVTAPKPEPPPAIAATPSPASTPARSELMPGTQVKRRAYPCAMNVDGAGRANGHPRADGNCMLYVEGGRFFMGAHAHDPSEMARPGDDPDALPDEGPVREVHVDAFWLGLTEVDVFLYRACVKAGACPASELRSDGGYWNAARAERLSHPANGVTWAGAAAYCGFVGGRLPTEAEWEYAARGRAGRRYPWGSARPSCALANIVEPGVATGVAGCGTDATWAVATEREGDPDVHLRNQGGNVWEWVADWYGPYLSSDTDNPRGPRSGTRKVQRGGGFDTSDPVELRAAYRAAVDPTLSLDDVGFRCAADLAAMARP